MYQQFNLLGDIRTNTWEIAHANGKCSRTKVTNIGTTRGCQVSGVVPLGALNCTESVVQRLHVSRILLWRCWCCEYIVQLIEKKEEEKEEVTWRRLCQDERRRVEWRVQARSGHGTRVLVGRQNKAMCDQKRWTKSYNTDQLQLPVSSSSHLIATNLVSLLKRP